MTYLAALIARAGAIRLDLNTAAAAERDRRNGLTILRPFIDQLQERVMPALERAAAELASAGVVLVIEPQFADDMQPKRAVIAVYARPGPDWPAGVEHTKGDWVEVQCGPGGTTVTVRPFAERDRIGDHLSFDGDAPAAAVEQAVSTMLDKAGAGPRMTGQTLRAPTAGVR